MTIALLILFGLFAVLAAFGVPVGFSMLAAGIGYLFWSGQDIGLLTDQVAGRLYASYALIAIPVFIFAANIMNAAKITDRIVNVAIFFLGRIPGGIAHANVASSVVFSGMSGSAVADVAGPGRVMMQVMTKNGHYTHGFAGAVTAASATIGPIIPPSIPIVLYAVISNSSVGALFLGGVVPGLIMAVAMIVVIAIMALSRDFGTEEGIKFTNIRQTIVEAFLPMLMPVILLGGIYLGVTTATESASIAAFYALLLAAIAYRTLNIKTLYNSVVKTIQESSSVSVTIAGAFIVSFAIANERLPEALADWLLSMDLSPVALLIAINVLFLLLGAVLDVSILLLVLVPLLLPSVILSGIDLVHFGIVIIVNIMVGLITPPYGLLLFVISSLTKASLKELILEIWPFVLMLLCVQGMLIYFPQLVLWLPQLLGFS